MKNPWKKLSSKLVYQDPWIKLRRDKVIKPDGKKGTYAYLQGNGPAVFIAALDEKKNIYLVGQWRYATGVFSWELPGGSSDNQNLLAAAKRELWEETGLTAKKWKKLAKYQTSSSLINEWTHLYLAQNLTQTVKNKQHEDHISQTKKVPLKTALKMVKNGKISDAQSLGALMLAKIKFP